MPFLHLAPALQWLLQRSRPGDGPASNPRASKSGVFKRLSSNGSGAPGGVPPLTERAVAKRLIQMANALRVCHAGGVVHHDVKLSNCESQCSCKDGVSERGVGPGGHQQCRSRREGRVAFRVGFQDMM
jgi:hypothetical protein